MDGQHLTHNDEPAEWLVAGDSEDGRFYYNNGGQWGEPYMTSSKDDATRYSEEAIAHDVANTERHEWESLFFKVIKA